MPDSGLACLPRCDRGVLCRGEVGGDNESWRGDNGSWVGEDCEVKSSFGTRDSDAQVDFSGDTFSEEAEETDGRGCEDGGELNRSRSRPCEGSEWPSVILGVVGWLDSG